jgi:hypothetical protein
MATQIVMDRSGDTRHEFDVKDANALAEADARFRALTCRGFLAVALSEDDGPGRQLRKFDPTVERTMFMPALMGG